MSLNYVFRIGTHRVFEAEKPLKFLRLRPNTRANEFKCVQVTVKSISGMFTVIEQVFPTETTPFWVHRALFNTRYNDEISAVRDFEG